MRSADLLVVGGGPAGCVAAWEAARQAPGASVALLERDPVIGRPVRCAEGVGAAGMREFLEPEGAPWVCRKITRVVIVAPDDTEVAVHGEEVGYVLDRTVLDPTLAGLAARAGADVLTATEATGLRRVGDGWEVATSSDRGEETWRARIVVGADGVESMVGRWAGLDTTVAAADMQSAAQYLLSGISFDPDAIYLQYSKRWAPGGYAWVFPKGDGLANVGLTITALRGDGRTALQYLDAWVAHRFPRGRPVRFTVGAVPTAPTVARTCSDGVLLAGDAAHMINPLSGAGIVNAMKAGRLAGRHAARALREGDTSAANLEPYHEEWMALQGRDHVWHKRINDAIQGMSDESLDRLARTVDSIPAHKRTLGRVVAEALVRQPSLLGVAARLFAAPWPRTRAAAQE